MPVPFEALIPYGIVLAMFGVTGAGLSKLRHWQNGHKRPRRSLDHKVRTSTEHPISVAITDMAKFTVMDRDRRLTGLLRGQSDEAIAPTGFEFNNPWRVEKRMA
ncbi:hypothetical protein GGR51DRAFT_574199 [Nemania sp. FL0031]|nr:hypothetical protein GGR51DRAFT_574199 [Nemania sp. FL0031]